MPSDEQEQPRDVCFVVFDAFSGGGVSRTTATLANHLRRTRRVRVISLYRRRAVPRVPLHPDIHLTVLRDMTRREPWWWALPARIPSRLRPSPSKTTMSLLTDVLLRKAIREVSDGIVISTRPSLHLAAVTFARRGVTTIGWDHLNFPARWEDPVQREVLRAAVPRMHGYAVLTSADATDYRAALPAASTGVRVLPNSVPWSPAVRTPPLDSKIIVAAGRLVPRKGFKRMVKSFAPLAETHPDWQLHIYGNGGQRNELLDLVSRLGLESQVRLPGYSDDLRSVLANASLFALSSTSEGFPMVLIEALSQGVPVIAFDCPRGPADIVHHGHNGLLITDGHRRQFTDALGMLMDDPALRSRLGGQALQDADMYSVDTVAAQWQAMFDDLGTAPSRQPPEPEVTFDPGSTIVTPAPQRPVLVPDL